jgi:hypothetical protein
MCGVNFFSISTLSSQSLNSVLLPYTQCRVCKPYTQCRVCKPQMSNMHTNAAVLLYLVVITQTTHCYECCTKDFLQTSPIKLQIWPVSSSACIFCTFSYYLKFSLLLELLSLICKLFPYVQLAHHKFFIWNWNHTSYSTHNLFSIHIRNPYSICR